LLSNNRRHTAKLRAQLRHTSAQAGGKKKKHDLCSLEHLGLRQRTLAQHKVPLYQEGVTLRNRKKEATLQRFDTVAQPACKTS
jgi:hypothetical protein